MADELQDKMKVKLDITNFSQWYNDVIELSNLSDKRYPIKGMNVWTPYGWKVMKQIDSSIRRECDATGHDEVHFPLLIPKTEFEKEKEHIKGFDAEVYWVTHGGLNELDVPMLLRPTSETAMYPMFSLWVRSHSDLPMKTYQIVNTFRYETKQTRSFIRVREIHFFEAHTCHEDFEDAERQIREDLKILRNVAKDLCLPYILSKRPEWDKFAGAFYTIGIEMIMPSGKTLQLGSIHQYKENFSQPYDIKYEDDTGGHKFVHQTTYGMSERLLGAVVGVHGDNQGLILPPKLAPYQVVITPILVKKKKDMVIEKARQIAEDLRTCGIRVFVDERDIHPGSKFYDWELKGVPLRLEVGPRDMEKEQVVLVRRDTKEKTFEPEADLTNTIKAKLDDIADSLWKKAEQTLYDSIIYIDDFRQAYDDDDNVMPKIFRMHWCGGEDCAEEIEKGLDLKVLGSIVPEDNPDFSWEKEEEKATQGSCIVCGAQTKTEIYVSKSY